jgi:adenylate cyclase
VVIETSPKPEKTSPRRLRVGDWLVDSARNEVVRGGRAVRLEPKAVEVLVHLATNPGEVVSREKLLAAVWPGVVVGDDALTQAIIKLRRALGDEAHKPTYIETISKRGYRLVAPVAGAEAAPAAPPARARPASGRLWLAAAGVFVIALGAVFAVSRVGGPFRMPWPITSDPRGNAGSPFPTVAVLPLANLSGDARRDYFSDGVTEDVINELGRFSGLRVMSRSAMQAFKGRSATPQAIRDELGARYVVQGSVREADGRVRVSVELSDADQGALLWSERYEGEGTQVFEIQDRIVKSIVGTLHVKLTELEHQRAFRKPTESLEAYDLVLRARVLVNRTDRAGNREARELLARAAKIAPGYAEVETVLGEAELQRAAFGWMEDAEDGMRRAEEHGRRALVMAEPRTQAGAHSLLAAVYTIRGRFDDAVLQTERAIALNPSDSTSLYRRGDALMWSGRIAEAIDVLEIARRFEPRPSIGRQRSLAIAYYLSGRYHEALAETDAMLARGPYDFLHALRAATLSELGRHDEARQAAAEARRLNPFFVRDTFGTRFADPKYTQRLHDGLAKAGL